jgi:hypothetical protein
MYLSELIALSSVCSPHDCTHGFSQIGWQVFLTLYVPHTLRQQIALFEIIKVIVKATVESAAKS